MNTKTNKDQPAFPSKLTGPCEAYGLKADATQVLEFSGMTLRDYFAAKAMQAIVSNDPSFSREFVELAAKDAYAYAEEMIKARAA